MRLQFTLLGGLACLLAGYAFAQTKPCRVPGFSTQVQCGVVQRPLNPADPSAGTIDVHYVVVHAVARNKKRDPVFFFAGGPGQSAIRSAPQVMPWFRRLNNWRDIVFIDQRGTGKSAPLRCAFDARGESLAAMLDMVTRSTWMLACLETLKQGPHGKALDQFATFIAMQDAEAVRAALGAEQINLVGISYGTRAALEYARQFPQRVRRAILDGVAPPDMILPATAASDAEAALEGWITGCAADAACAKAYPTLRKDLQSLLQQAPLKGTAIHPLTGREETITLSRDQVVSLLRAPLYVPLLAATVPYAISEAAAGRLTPLVGISASLGNGLSEMYWGTHFSVICSEDYPRLATHKEPTSAVFGESFANIYVRVCAAWPKARVPEAFYSVPTAQFAALVLSGGADPVTPPRHGERTAKALGAKAKHIVVEHAAHGVLAIGCMRDEMVKFIDAETDAQALAVDGACAKHIPRPSAWVLTGEAK